MLFTIAARLLIIRFSADDSIWFFPLTALQQNPFVFRIFTTIRRIYTLRPEWIDRIGQSRIIRHADDLSFYVYIVHYMFLIGSFSVSCLPVGRVLQCAVFCAATFVCAEALRAVTLLLQKWIMIPLHLTESPKGAEGASRS